MALANQSDVEERLGRSLTVSEANRVNGLLEEASDIVAGWLGPTKCLTDPVPGAVTRVVSRMVARLFESPAGTVGVQGQQMSAGPYQISHTVAEGARSGSPWLTKSDRTALRKCKLGAFSYKTWG